MAVFKVGTTAAFHEKVVNAGLPAMGLWVRAGSWCARQSPDGFVPDVIVRAIASDTDAGADALADRLVQVRLWHRVPGGFVFHQWAEHQRGNLRSKGELRARIRDALREQVYERDRRRCVTCGATEGLTLDHIKPWSRLGKDTLDNLQTLCGSCNSRKGAREAGTP